MMKSHRTALLAAFGLVLTTFGCSSSEGASSAGEPASTRSASAMSSTSFCEVYCTRYTSCDASMDAEMCVNQCVSGVASVLPKLRYDVLQDTLACVQEEDCRRTLGGNALSDCLAEAQETAAPTAAAKAFCSAFSDVVEKCIGEDVSMAGCLSSVKMFNDESLASATRCTTLACGSVGDCVDAAL